MRPLNYFFRATAVAGLLLLQPLQIYAEGTGEGDERAYVVYDYRYDPAGSGGDPDTGHALCGNRCNALSFDYADYIMADPREVKKVAAGRELTIPLDNPFLQGNCICSADEYLIKLNARHRPKPK